MHNVAVYRRLTLVELVQCHGVCPLHASRCFPILFLFLGLNLYYPFGNFISIDFLYALLEFFSAVSNFSAVENSSHSLVFHGIESNKILNRLKSPNFYDEFFVHKNEIFIIS
jgi:hypothetical protein